MIEQERRFGIEDSPGDLIIERMVMVVSQTPADVQLFRLLIFDPQDTSFGLEDFQAGLDNGFKQIIKPQGGGGHFPHLPESGQFGECLLHLLVEMGMLNGLFDLLSDGDEEIDFLGRELSFF
jgi:hypothetical protein